MWIRLGYKSDDPSTWKAERVNMPHHKSEPVKTFAPKAWAAMCELVGGQERLHPDSHSWMVRSQYSVHNTTAKLTNPGQPHRQLWRSQRRQLHPPPARLQRLAHRRRLLHTLPRLPRTSPARPPALHRHQTPRRRHHNLSRRHREDGKPTLQPP